VFDGGSPGGEGLPVVDLPEVHWEVANIKADFSHVGENRDGGGEGRMAN